MARQLQRKVGAAAGDDLFTIESSQHFAEIDAGAVDAHRPG